MRKLFLICTLIFSALAQPLLAAEKDDLPKLKTTAKTLAVFKNGLGFVFRSGQTPLKGGWAAMDEIPPAVLGTLWIGTTNPSARVQEVVSYKCPSEESVDAVSISDLLEVNAGRWVTLTYLTHATPETECINATIISVPSGGQIALIQAQDGTIRAINKADVLAITLDKDAPLKKKKEKTVNCAKVRVGSNTKKGEEGTHRRGIRDRSGRHSIKSGKKAGGSKSTVAAGVGVRPRSGSGTEVDLQVQGVAQALRQAVDGHEKPSGLPVAFLSR